MGCVKLVFFMLYVFLFQLFVSSSLPHLCPEDQALALLEFKNMFTVNPNASDYCYDMITGVEIQSYPRTLSWNKSTDCCSWDGVHCDETTGQVIALDLCCSQLQGKFHSNSSLFQLSNLKRLDLSFNHFTGSPISPKFGEFSDLTHLDLSHSSFTGVIPSEFLSFNRSWTQLEELDFSSNSLTGPIPSNVSGLRNLQSLYLSSNNLNGSIPSWIFSLPSLIELYLSNNTFSGKIQEFKSKTLSVVSLKQNQLEGPIPNSLLNQKSLSFLLLSHNNISGHISSSICNLKTLILLDLGSNNLEGTIPQCLGEMKEYLLDLDLSNNRLSGTINTTFSVGNSLRVISLHGNKLTGKVPRSLINCKYLTLLDLGNNMLNDTFPNWLGYLSQLKILSLRSNKLHGPIKSSRNTNLFTRLQILDLSSNGFSGNLPESILGNLQAMKKIDESTRTPQYISDTLYYYLTTITTKGQDYDSVRIFTSNMIINLSKNRFEGRIPSIIGYLVGLRTLNLSHNALEGQIRHHCKIYQYSNQWISHLIKSAEKFRSSLNPSHSLKS